MASALVWGAMKHCKQKKKQYMATCAPSLELLEQDERIQEEDENEEGAPRITKLSRRTFQRADYAKAHWPIICFGKWPYVSERPGAVGGRFRVVYGAV